MVTRKGHAAFFRRRSSRKTQYLTRRERENLRQRNEILGAALRLFAEKGYHRVSMHEIAREAEFGIGTLYKYFNNKQELYQSLIHEVAEKFHHAVLEALREESDPLAAIRKHVMVRYKLVSENLPVVRLYYAETRSAGLNVRAGFDQELLKQHDEFIEILSGVFEQGVRKGVFRKLDPYGMALALDGILNAFLFRMVEQPERFRDQNYLSTATDVFLNGVVEKREKHAAL